MCTTAARLSLGLLVAVAALGGGCARAVDPAVVLGAYSVTVAAFGKTDPDIVVASQGGEADVILNFNYGIETEYNAVNATGLRADLTGGNDIELDVQPIRVTHSSGYIVGTVTGKGTVDGSKIAVTLTVTPSTQLTGTDGQPLSPTGKYDYVVSGARQ